MAPRPQRPRDDFVGVVNDILRRVRALELGATGRRGGGATTLQWTPLYIASNARDEGYDHPAVAWMFGHAMLAFRGHVVLPADAFFSGNYLQLPLGWWSSSPTVAATTEVFMLAWNAQGGAMKVGIRIEVRGEIWITMREPDSPNMAPASLAGASVPLHGLTLAIPDNITVP